jgi:vacuolar-type H+-ATPase subunit H
MGLDGIIERILQDAQKETDRIIEESQNKAEDIKRKARKQAEEHAKALIEKAKKDGDLEARRIVTQARLEKKIHLLNCKKELIGQVLEKAFQKEIFQNSRFMKKIVTKDGEKEEALDREKLKRELRPRLENTIAEVLKV